MPIITLPDGNKLTFDKPVTVHDIASQIGAGLAKAALAGKVDDQLVDTDYVIDHDAALEIITAKSPEGLDIIRHSTAHLMAHAVQMLFPDIQVTIGPTIENGFYYDFAFERSFVPEDLEQIERQMAELTKQDLPIKRKVMMRDDAIKLFEEKGEKYKVEIIREIPADQEISLYEQGDFIDLCRGPHVPSTSKLKAFKLMKIAGAYWRGDSRNEMLQRIYGTAWADKKDLNAYLHRLEEAEKRDHRKIGKALNLFHFQEEAPGMVFWHNNGWIIYQIIAQYMRKKLREYDYQEVNTPLMMDRVLWERSGHWDKFGEVMFTTESENRDYAIKPMNCPGHMQIFNQGLKSYRDLPLRIAEFGLCHRNEPSGTLHGLMRIRQFTQDDAHIFCTEGQLQDEVFSMIKMLYEVYTDFGFENIVIRLATRPEKRIGEDEVWDRSEKALEVALNAKELEWELAPGEGAFYGPKIEFHLRDCLDRVWQCGTIQLDLSMPERLGAYYIDEEGNKRSPVTLHRVIFGSMERFIGILLEHYAGKLPFWLAPIQVTILNITDKQADYVKNITKILKKHDIRVISDLRNEKIGFKIRQQTLMHVPFMLVVGDKELANQTVAVRKQSGEDLGSMSLDEFLQKLKEGGRINDKRARINKNIRATEVRLISAEGEQIGICSITEALEKAQGSGLDLVEISPNAKPPVCKIMDYEKYRFQLIKKKKEAKRQQKRGQVKVKKLRIRPGIEDGDYQVKLRNLIRFLKDGDRVEISLRFRGREIAHKELGMELLKRIQNDLAEYADIEREPKFEGRQMMMVVVPKRSS